MSSSWANIFPQLLDMQREFLKLKKGTMTVLEYVAKFIELARFVDENVAIDMAKVRKFEDGLKLSIRGKIVVFLQQDMDSLVRTNMAMEREIDDAWRIRAAGDRENKRDNQSSSSSGKHEDFKDMVEVIRAKAKSWHLARRGR